MLDLSGISTHVGQFYGILETQTLVFQYKELKPDLSFRAGDIKACACDTLSLGMNGEVYDF